MRKVISESQVHLSEDEQQMLERVATRCSGHSPEARRARIVLLLAEGKSVSDIRQILACSPQTVAIWRRRFLKFRIAGLARVLPSSSVSRPRG